jgi:hypothetical protein
LDADIRPQAVIHSNPHNILNVSAELALGALSEAFQDSDFQSHYRLTEVKNALASERPTEHEARIRHDFAIVHVNALHNFRE